MSIIQFGKDLLRTGDLDPVYTAIYTANLPIALRQRLALAYWCFYHLGVAAHIAERGVTPRKFWELTTTAAVNEGLKWPRGSERRHFRGAQSLASVAELRDRYRSPEDAVVAMTSGGTFDAVSRAARTHRGFGPWIAFKIADMAERVLDVDVDFSACELGIYKDPRQGAAVAYLEALGAGSLIHPDGFVGHHDEPWNYPIADRDLRTTCDYYVKQFKTYKAPPAKDRRVNIQEVETIFCKYKSHLKGHYPLGKDTHEVAHGLDGWGDLAQQLKKGLGHG